MEYYVVVRQWDKSTYRYNNYIVKRLKINSKDGYVLLIDAIFV